MIANIFLGLAFMIGCMMVQALLVAIALQYYLRKREQIDPHSFARTLGTIVTVKLLLVIGSLVQITIWGVLFWYLGEFSEFTTAAYHSAVNFSTLGYGDIVMSEERRILGPMESINGVLMIGVSTAVLMSTLQDTLRRAYKARHES
jgi:hypothetical protein